MGLNQPLGDQDPMGTTRDQDVIEGIGMGPAQIAWGLLGGGIWLADGAELLLVSAVTRWATWSRGSSMKLEWFRGSLAVF